MKPITTMLACFILVVGLASFSVKNSEIEGTIYDEFKTPLANAEVYNVTNGFTTYSDAAGHFVIRAKEKDELRFSFEDKLPKTFIITNTGNIKVYFDDRSKLARIKEEKRDSNKITYTTDGVEIEQKSIPAAYQGFSFAGKIVNEILNPIIGATITISGTSTFAQTDANGYFGINASNGDRININSKGFVSRQIEVKDVFAMRIMMQSSDVFSDTKGKVYRAEYDTLSSGKTVLKKTSYSTTVVTEKAITKDESYHFKSRDVIIEDTDHGREEISEKTYHDGDAKTGADYSYENYYSVGAESDGTTDVKDSEDGKITPAPVEESIEVFALEKADYDSDLKTYLSKPGRMTAGELNDFSKWEYWQDISKETLQQWQVLWQMSPTFRYTISVVNKDGFPVINKMVHLENKSGTKLWTARTDNTGKAELWYNPHQNDIAKVTEKLKITDDSGRTLVKNAIEFHKGINKYTSSESCNLLSKIDIAFMIDATGSMTDEIHYLQEELNDVIEKTKTNLPETELSMAAIFYRDTGDDYLTKNLDFTADTEQVNYFINRQSAQGGNDFPEAVTEACEIAINQLSWHDDARARLLFVVLDAPPHDNPESIAKLQQLAKKAAQKGIRIIPIAASGMDKSAEYLMRAMALQTNGTYLFLTDDSGIGNPHMKPSTDSYKVEKLNELIIRITKQFTEAVDCKTPEETLPENDKLEAQSKATASPALTYFPNPTSGIVTVRISEPVTEILLFDTTGKLVTYQKGNSSNTYTFDLTGLPNAVYYLQAVAAERKMYGKIVKKG